MSPAGWADLVVDGLPAAGPEAAAVLLDPGGLVPADALPGWRIVPAPTPWGIRRAYEQHIRHRPPGAGPLLIHATAPAITRPDQLHWDIAGQAPVARLDPRIPERVLRALPELPAGAAAAAVGAAAAGSDPAPAVAALVLGSVLPAADAGAELLAAARSRDAGLGPAARALLAAALTHPAARDAMGDPGPDGALAAAWRDWCARGPGSPHHAMFAGCGPAVLSLADAGALTLPAAPPPGAPGWLAGADPADGAAGQVEELLRNQPVDHPASYTDWVETAAWWSRIRWACATGRVPETAVARAWDRWTGLDQRFRQWLQAHYASELGRGFLPPRTVDKIAPYLAYRLRRTGRPQVLAVMDGMGLPQWRQLRAAAGAVEAERHVLLAAIPTITQVSRQAIFAGTTPDGFADTIRSPAEERLWRQFWSGEGVGPQECHYARSDGRTVPPVPPGARAVGLVFNNIDDAMHAAGGYDDPGFRDLVERFARTGIVGQLLDTATERGWDLWFTADHGNLPCRGLPDRIPRQGVRVRSRGKRVWTYADPVLRDAADVPGTVWDPPGFPNSAGAPLFAVGRACYERDAVLVSHGSLSLDEVLVPLVRVQT